MVKLKTPEGYEIEGEMEEVMEILKGMTKQTPKFISVKKKEKSAEESPPANSANKWERAVEYYKKGYSAKVAMTKVFGTDKICGQDYTRFKKELKKHGILYEKRRLKHDGYTKIKNTEEKAEQALQYYREGDTQCKAIKKAFGGIGGFHYRKLRELINKTGAQRGEVKKKDRKKTDMRTKRFLFIQRRVNSITKELNCNYQTAFRQAAEEWRQGAAFGTVKPIGKPQLLGNDDKNKILLDILKNVVNNGTKMTRRVDGAAVGCETAADWKKIVYIVMNHREEICAYFQVPPKLRIVTESNELTLEYRK